MHWDTSVWFLWERTSCPRRRSGSEFKSRTCTHTHTNTHVSISISLCGNLTVFDKELLYLKPPQREDVAADITTSVLYLCEQIILVCFYFFICNTMLTILDKCWKVLENAIFSNLTPYCLVCLPIYLFSIELFCCWSLWYIMIYIQYINPTNITHLLNITVLNMHIILVWRCFLYSTDR